MLGHELAVEQPETTDQQARHQPGERHLRGIGAEREHALAEKGAAEADAVQAAHQLALFADFDRMGVAILVKPDVAGLDLGIDPGVGSAGAQMKNLRESPVAGHLELI